jgi:hypothetical protein
MRDVSASNRGPPRAVGWIGLDAPIELVEAAGRRPHRIVVDARQPSPAAQLYGEGGGHPWMRAIISRLVQERSEVERVVLCSTPATELWIFNFLLSLERRGEADGFPPATLLNFSHQGRPSAARLNSRSMEGLARTLGASAAALGDAIAARNRVRAALRQIDSQRYGSPTGLSGTDARRLMDPADSLRSEAYLVWAAGQPQCPPAAGLPVIYSSPMSPPIARYAALEALGMRIVGDDTDIGSRAIGPDTAEQSDGLEALAQRYAARDPAPAGWPTGARVDYLLGMARSRRARAVLFDLPAWEHPAAWDFPAQRQALEGAGIAWVRLPDGVDSDPDCLAQAAHEALRAMIGEGPSHE